MDGKDGFIKEPAVATRENFNTDAYTPEQLERLKLEDGIHVHEATKVELETYGPKLDALIAMGGDDTQSISVELAKRGVNCTRTRPSADSRWVSSRRRLLSMVSNQCHPPARSRI